MLQKIFKKSLVSIFLFGWPALVLATNPTLGTVVTNISSTILGPLVGVLLTLALVVFFWGMVKYLNSLGSEKDKKDGKDIMIWGIIALFVMISVWGLVKLLQGSLLGGASTAPFPVISMPGSS